MAEKEGVIKYQLDWKEGPEIAPFDFGSLTNWHLRFKASGLLGQDPERYEGYGFGNISERLNQQSFLISGTQTGHLQDLAPKDYAVVVRALIETNQVFAEGPVKPSSEALTHAAVYALEPDIRFVFHVHSPAIWQQRQSLELPETSADVPYGTPQMAAEVKRLHETGALDAAPLFAMAGHEDGIIGFGKTADEAGGVIMDALGRTSLKGRSLA